ncbi:unnamed protein product [Phyllotreta striolata]|uniref:Beta-mannosidase B n=1 Tax=Phyllotreta striolata TaxID=444603 RepID=A0A9N9XSQ3_PHYSR|nr:unnamed protein product [Phyllotreta striolata]
MFLRILCCAFALKGYYCAEIVTLNGDWLLNDDKNNITNVKATVPGGIYSDLMSNGVIGDIYYGYNDENTKWIPRLNWTYSRSFQIAKSLLLQENINIVFDGLDTFSSIYLNNQLIGESSNMHVQYIFDVKSVLKQGENRIEVKFLSPIETASKLATIQEQNYPVPPSCPPSAYHGECHVNMIRKMQASFSWDWGPSFPSVGIWKDVYIESYNESLIRYVVNDVTEAKDDKWRVNLDVYLANNRRNAVRGKIQLDFSLQFVYITNEVDVNCVINEHNELVVTTYVEIPKAYVNVWWPNGFGSSDLYTLKVTYYHQESEISVKTIRIGFRTIELVQKPLGSNQGLTFYFNVNKVPIFMKGSNEIPIDILPEFGRNKTRIKHLLSSARDTHMNMIRVWGGGVYESDYFYDLADEFGIIIWQDFMFACAMYPSSDSFLQNVLGEVRHQVKRLYGHASVAIFSGNNENEGALVGNWYGTASNYQQYYEDYIKLYVTTIKSEFDRLTGGRGIFITSSPTNGKESDSEGYVAKKPTSTLYGDVHFYNYILNPFNSNFYPIPRFASEYGYQSLPSFHSFLTATNDTNDLNINSSFMNHRQHHPLGNIEMQLLMKLYFKFPNTSGDDFAEGVIYYSQIVQALGIKVESEHYRRCRSSLNDKGEGYTMGALFWQLNDVWMAPSWSGIDYLGKWKMLQYYAKNFFAPIIVTGHVNVQNVLDVYLVSDVLSPLDNLTVSILVYNWTNFKPINVENVLVDTQIGSSAVVKSIQIDDYLKGIGCSKTDCFFYFTVEKEGAKIAPDNFAFPTAIKDSSLSPAKVAINSIKQIYDKIFDIELTSDKIALFVWLENLQVEGRFSDNGFIINQPTQHVYFTAHCNYALCLLLIVFLEVAISASAYISRDHIAARLEEDMYTSMYHFNDETNFLWRASQSNLHCCGVRGPNDWGKFQSIFGNLLENATYNDVYNATPRNYIVPSSCCRNETCNTAYSLYIQGCLPRINFIFSQSALLLGVGAMCITFIQLLGAIFAHLLARSIRKLKTQVEVERNIRRQQLYEQLAQAKNAETKTTPVLYVPSTSEA